jgi:hypothetical protein
LARRLDILRGVVAEHREILFAERPHELRWAPTQS